MAPGVYFWDAKNVELGLRLADNWCISKKYDEKSKLIYYCHVNVCEYKCVNVADDGVRLQLLSVINDRSFKDLSSNMIRYDPDFKSRIYAKFIEMMEKYMGEKKGISDFKFEVIQAVEEVPLTNNYISGIFRESKIILVREGFEKLIQIKERYENVSPEIIANAKESYG